MEVHPQQESLKKELSEFLNLDTYSTYPTVANIMEDDGDDKNDTKRKFRNLSEKKRRDHFNSLVTELSSLISNNNRKMDKSTILRSTISFLKNHNELTVQSRVHDVQEDWKPSYLSNEEFTYLVLEALEGFIMVFSTSGQIYYASESITSLLGHNPAEIVNKNIFDMMHKDDQKNLYNLLQRNAAKEHIESKVNEMLRFQVHLQRGCLDFREEVSYDVVQFYGHFRINQEQDNEQDVMDFRNVESSSRVLFVCIGCLHTPKLIRDVSLVDSTCNEFTSRHSLEWKFLFLDHRAPPIIGYLPFELLGTSGYDYYHFDDLEKVVNCHEALMQKGELTSCYYRFLTKGQQWIWLQTRYYITYHQWNSKPEFVVCAHRVVSYADVLKTKEELVEQDTVLTQSDNAASINVMPDEDPQSKLSSRFKMSEANDAYDNVYPCTSQPSSVKRPSALVKGGTVAQAAASTADTWIDAEALYTGGSGTSVPGQSREPSSVKRPSALVKGGTVAQAAASTADTWIDAEALYTGGSGTSVPGQSREPSSVKRPSALVKGGTVAQAAASTADTWIDAEALYTGGSGTSVPGQSREPHIQPLQSQPLQPTKQDCCVASQHGMDIQYPDSTSYIVGAVSSGLLSMAGEPPQDQEQDQLQRKHEELKQMLARQQEELRHVKEQLALARLGILHPIVNVPGNSYSATQEELQNQEPNYSAQGPLPELGLPSIPAQPPQHLHPDHRHMPQ